MLVAWRLTILSPALFVPFLPGVDARSKQPAGLVDLGYHPTCANTGTGFETVLLPADLDCSLPDGQQDSAGSRQWGLAWIQGHISVGVKELRRVDVFEVRMQRRIIWWTHFRPLPQGGRHSALQEWPHPYSPEWHALVSSLSSSTSLSYAACHSLPPSSQHNDFDLLNPFAWDQAAANYLDLDPASTAATDLSSLPTPELDQQHNDNVPTPHFDTSTPFLDCFPSTSFPVPLSYSTDTSLSNTPSTSTVQSPPDEAPNNNSNGAAALVPGLKLPPQRPSNKPGRKPAAASSLTRTTDGRITKKRITTTTTTTPSGRASLLFPAGDELDDDPDDVVLRRQRNNLAAKRYRQKKLDRIEELEKEVERVKQERDELKIRVARQEAEVAALREMLQLQKGGGSGTGSKD
ncbi:uncharacterized protein B0T15DRAFT_508218 [Chaetomium strumarium]|uniref:BZIP domain-containing protein n=1 Tax=Chaetomium strumarium TaxID=1170767 RepID=A0AAJ0H4I7_9PEZI|nr:hypothetical protein B0T15DRAFT_508218 [Chaetomium strumarium]